ncbi:DEAD/DEAH box helicase [Deinococcus radiopugnans]|uniref:DEAD/DEAH box helicase n=1 Tax=Deinococcus radiopugnans TaxID=57497 RepID=UPI00068FBF3C|nr:nuclease-related domain-containing DEAD/DEAH box helicase [Deinococcus radiopugnans]
MAQFIVTEAIAGDGATAETRVWQAVREAWRTRDAVVYWRYPIFTPGVMREPDILILDRVLGLIVIEVKSLRDGQLLRIDGHTWSVQEYVTKTIQPYEQARQQVQALLNRLHVEPALVDTVPSRALVGLPFMSRRWWESSGFARLPSSPPCLFAEDLTPEHLLNLVQRAPSIQARTTLDDATWVTMRSFLSAGGALRSTAPVEAGISGQKADIMTRARAHRHDFDHQQELIARLIPPGPQRIRGIAGSGKTVLLAQRAAAMRLKHPDWTIGLVFFNRSLYNVMERQVDRWLRHYSDDQVTLQGSPQLHVFHAWGGAKRDGFYRMMARHHHVKPRAVMDYNGDPAERLAQACRDLLQDVDSRGGIQPLFDALLLDESQDLVVAPSAFRFKNRQPIFWLAHESLRPVDKTGQRRLVWAYDEAQSLNARAIPTARELFGEGAANLVAGTHEGGARKSEIMHRCYRTPEDILVAAHALGMGLMREDGMLTGLTNQREWQDIGYTVDGQFISGRTVTLRRPPAHSPNPLKLYWKDSVMNFHFFNTREAEIDRLMHELQRNTNFDGFAASRQILVVVLGQGRKKNALVNEICRRMAQAHLDFYLPGQLQKNDTSATDWRVRNPNIFWWDGAITVTDVHKAKGNEADMVHVVGLDAIANDEDSVAARNQLFTAMTRTRGWLHVSGTQCSQPFTAEVDRVVKAQGVFTFVYRRPPKRDLAEREPEKAKPDWLADWSST